MARPIPVNEAGLRRGQRFEATSFAPAQDAIRQARPVSPYLSSVARSSLNGRVLLLISSLAGGLAVVSALGPWPELDAAGLGLNEQGAFYLLVGGIYVLATAFYAAWRTRLLYGLDQAPWDARLMAYANYAVGGLIILMLSAVVMAMLAIILALAWFGALLLSGAGGPAQD